MISSVLVTCSLFLKSAKTQAHPNTKQPHKRAHAADARLLLQTEHIAHTQSRASRGTWRRHMTRHTAGARHTRTNLLGRGAAHATHTRHRGRRRKHSSERSSAESGMHGGNGAGGGSARPKITSDKKREVHRGTCGATRAHGERQ